MAVVACAVALGACGDDEYTTAKPRSTPELTVPTGELAASGGAQGDTSTSTTSTSTTPDGATTTGAAPSGDASGGTAAPAQPQGGGTAAPAQPQQQAPAQPQTPAQQQPSGGAAPRQEQPAQEDGGGGTGGSEFEDFCSQNPGAC